MYSTFNEGKSVVAERFIRTLKNKIFKHMTAISKNVYFDVSDDIVNKYNNIVHKTIKMKPIDVTNDSFVEYNVNIVTNQIVKKNTYDKLVAKVNNIDTKEFLLKTKYDADKTELENKIPHTSNLIKKTDYNTKITELENKIPDISNLATKAPLTTVENKIPDISNLATKAALTTVENKIPNISNLTTETLVNNVKDKIPNISNIVKKSDFNTKITNIENNVRQLQAYDLSYFKGKQYFDEGSGKQNYLVFLPMRKYFKLDSIVGVIDYVLSWQSKGLSNESIKPSTTSNNSFNPTLNYYGTKTRAQFIGSCLKQSSHIFTHKKIVNIYDVYELAASSSHTSDTAIKNCLFGAVTLTKNADV